MAKNILIFSDGTGQAGGLTADENVSNIYKLFRATRCGPDSDIDPSEQLTFYDPGLGSQPESGVFGAERAYRWVHNLVSQATGLGITMNIVDCYAAILRMWQPGDTHVQYAVGLPGYSFFQTLHFTAPKMQFYDKHLDNTVWYARHAMSIDENRADFARVPWGSTQNKGPPRPDSYPEWLDQIWFAGVHSDIGGSYSENESRLSDIALEWMIHSAENLPNSNTPNANGIKIDRSFLKLHPDPCGPQRDATEPGYFGGRVSWWTGPRHCARSIRTQYYIRQYTKGLPRKGSNISTLCNRIGLQICQSTKS